MAVKTIEYTVSESGISPATVMQGGTQGDHNATELAFTLTDEFLNMLAQLSDTGALYYRFDGYSGTGIMNPTVPEQILLDGKPLTLSYPLENWITKDGGNITVNLVISLESEEETGLELYSFPALLRLKPRSGRAAFERVYKSLTNSLLEIKLIKIIANELANSADASASAARESASVAREYVKEAKKYADEMNNLVGGFSHPTFIRRLGTIGNVYYRPMVEANIDDQGSVILVYDEALNPIRLKGFITTGNDDSEAVNVGYLKNFTKGISVSDTLPEAKEENRGRMVIVPNGENDEVYICLLIGGAFTWLNLGTGMADSPVEPDEPDSNEVVLDSVTYVLDDSTKTATVTDCYTSKSGEVIIPSDVNGYSVTAIGETAFMGCYNIETVTIPDSVETIGQRAFSNCSQLTSITIPKSVTSIGAGAFYYTSLANVYYSGSESNWNNIVIGETNNDLTRATISYSETDNPETSNTAALLGTAILGKMIIGKEN